MDKKENKTVDEYRQERKERIAKQHKASAKKSRSHEGAKNAFSKILGALVAVVVVVAILAAGLNFFGVPQRLIKSVTIDGESYSMSELSCYYMQVYNNYANNSYNYDTNYGEGYGKIFTGYDYNLSPSEQSTKDDDGNSITWDEKFLDEAVEQLANVKRYYNAAVDANISLSDEDNDDIDATIESIETQIKTYGNQTSNYSVSRYLTLMYGKGVTESFFRKVLKEQKLVELYQESRQTALEENYSADDVNKIYSESRSEYDSVDFRWYTIDVNDGLDEDAVSKLTDEEKAANLAAAKAKAETFISKVTSVNDYNEQTFKDVVLETVGTQDANYETYKEEAATLLQKTSYEKIKTNVSEDAAKWLFEANDKGEYVRTAGDIKYYVSSDESTIYILFATGVPYKNETKHVSVRHILVKFPDETEAVAESVTGEEETSAEAVTEDGAVSEKTKAECKKEAESILADYNAYIKENFDGKPDEDYFIELVGEHTDDTGSKEDGGLISHMANDGSYVAAFEDWAFTEGEFEGEKREPGSTAVIESEYGYHVMYYVEQEEHPEWYATILDELVSEDWEKEQDEFEKKFAEDAIVRNAKVEAWVKDACLDIIG